MEVFGYIDSRQNRISEKTYFTTYNMRNMFWATILNKYHGALPQKDDISKQPTYPQN